MERDSPYRGTDLCCKRKEENGIEINMDLKVILFVTRTIRIAEDIIFQINLSSWRFNLAL
jgi:hypothetical protein